MPLPTTRTPGTSRVIHAQDHNTLHAQYNELEPMLSTGIVLDDDPRLTGGGGGGGLDFDYLLASGIYYTSPGSATAGDLVIANGTTWLYAIPFPFIEAVAFNRIGVETTSALDGQFGHIGIYGPGTGTLAGQPGPRLWESDDIAISGMQAARDPGLTLQPGTHWLAWKSMPPAGGPNYSIRSLANGQTLGMPVAYPGTGRYVGWRIADALANNALPDPFPTLDATHLVSEVPLIVLGTLID